MDKPKTSREVLKKVNGALRDVVNEIPKNFVVRGDGEWDNNDELRHKIYQQIWLIESFLFDIENRE